MINELEMEKRIGETSKVSSLTKKMEDAIAFNAKSYFKVDESLIDDEKTLLRRDFNKILCKT